jgi:4-hydroxy 2-oxovalerate aldolase
MLDCTLRDGGYINDWYFGFENTREVIRGLVASEIDIIEVGYLSQTRKHEKGRTIYNTLSEISEVLPTNRGNKMFVVMINFGEYNVEDIPDYDGSSINGIRVVFHKKQLEGAAEFCKKLSKKGYRVFFQPMVAMSYTDDEFLATIKSANEINPFAFYIVDSFGVMKQQDLLRFYFLSHNNLNEEITLGYHSHNNLQLAYSNAQTFATLVTSRNLIIDSSIFGMGRGAGNLNTELFTQFLNEAKGTDYAIEPLLKVIDEVIAKEHEKNFWGYSLPFYISAKHNVHPNYASFLDDKNTLTFEGLDTIISRIEGDKKSGFSPDYAEELYIAYMSEGKTNEQHIGELKEKLSDKSVLIIGPGKSAQDEVEKLRQFANDENVVVVSINHEFPEIKPDFVFLSNARRLSSLPDDLGYKLIVTSNVSAKDYFLKVSYANLVNEVATVEDNAGLMAINLFEHLGVKKIYLAGIDGYSAEARLNYADENYMFEMKQQVRHLMNAGMQEVINDYAQKADIEFVTSSNFKIGERVALDV